MSTTAATAASGALMSTTTATTASGAVLSTTATSPSRTRTLARHDRAHRTLTHDRHDRDRTGRQRPFHGRRGRRRNDRGRHDRDCQRRNDRARSPRPAKAEPRLTTGTPATAPALAAPAGHAPTSHRKSAPLACPGSRFRLTLRCFFLQTGGAAASEVGWAFTVARRFLQLGIPVVGPGRRAAEAARAPVPVRKAGRSAPTVAACSALMAWRGPPRSTSAPRPKAIRERYVIHPSCIEESSKPTFLEENSWTPTAIGPGRWTAAAGWPVTDFTVEGLACQFLPFRPLLLGQHTQELFLQALFRIVRPFPPRGRIGSMGTVPVQHSSNGCFCSASSFKVSATAGSARPRAPRCCNAICPSRRVFSGKLAEDDSILVGLVLEKLGPFLGGTVANPRKASRPVSDACPIALACSAVNLSSSRTDFA